MTLADLSSLGSFISGIAVLASLIFVGFQLRQNTQAVRATASQAHASNLQQIVTPIVENGDVARLWRLGMTDMESLTLSDLASVGSFISGVAVLFSLIYLGVQIRQNALAQRATAHQSVQAFMRQHQRMLMEGELASIFSRGLAAEVDMTEVELMQFHAMARDFLSFHEECHWLNSRGMLDDDGIKTSSAGLSLLLRYPGFRAAWRLSRFSFSRGYAELVDGDALAAASQGNHALILKAGRQRSPPNWQDRLVDQNRSTSLMSAFDP